MLTVITYDVNTEDPAGRQRLRKVARHCVNYGQRVQNSVFECIADAAEMVRIKSELVELIDPEKDSLRFYYCLLYTSRDGVIDVAGSEVFR